MVDRSVPTIHLGGVDPGESGPSHPLIIPIAFNSSSLYLYDPNEKINEFLKHDYEGLVVLSAFELTPEKCLTDDARNLLVKKLIDRETNIFLSNSNYKVGVKLDKFKIESSRFKSLADEIGEVFNEEPGLYFTPFAQEGTIKINATGKLWDRYNYVKKVLRNAESNYNFILIANSIDEYDFDEHYQSYEFKKISNNWNCLLYSDLMGSYSLSRVVTAANGKKFVPKRWI